MSVLENENYNVDPLHNHNNDDYDLPFIDNREIDEDSFSQDIVTGSRGQAEKDSISQRQATSKKKRSESSADHEPLKAYNNRQMEGSLDEDSEESFPNSNDNYNNTENKRSEELQHDDKSHNVIDSDHNQNVGKPYNLRKIRSKTAYGDCERTFYDYDYNLCQHNENSNILKMGVCATQLSAKKGIKIFGDKSVSVIVDE